MILTGTREREKHVEGVSVHLSSTQLNDKKKTSAARNLLSILNSCLGLLPILTCITSLILCVTTSFCIHCMRQCGYYGSLPGLFGQASGHPSSRATPSTSFELFNDHCAVASSLECRVLLHCHDRTHDGQRPPWLKVGNVLKVKGT